MAEQIDSLFVRLGLETDQEQFQQAESMFSGLQSTILQFAGAVGAGIGLDELTRGFSETLSEMDRFADRFSTTPQFVNQLGHAYKLIGGDADDAYGSIRQVADLIEQTEWGEIPSDAFREAGFDPRMLEGVEGFADAYERISGAIEGMDREKARRALSSLGFDEQAIDLFRQGPEEIRRMMQEGADFSPVTGEMTEQAIAFDKATARLTSSMDGVKNELSTLFVGDMAETMEDIARFLKENRREIKAFADEALPYIRNIAGALGVLVGINMARSSLGIFKNIPFLTGATAAAATYIYRNSGDPVEGQNLPSGEEGVENSRSRLDRMGDMPEGLSFGQQQRWMQGDATERSQIMATIQIDAGNNSPEAIAKEVRAQLMWLSENTERDLEEPLQ